MTPLGLLEPDAVKVARPVLRGPGSSNGLGLPDKRSKGVPRVKVSADGRGVVSHAGVGMLGEVAEFTGLADGVTTALLDTYRGVPVHAPGRVFTDLACAIANGADGRCDLRDRGPG